MENLEAFIIFFIFSCFLIISIPYYALQIIGMWKVFDKAGEKGWKAFIPGYDVYTLAKISKCTNFFWIILGSYASYIMSIFMEIMIKETVIDEAFIIIPLSIAIASLVLIVVYFIKLFARLSTAFGKSKGYAVGLYFLLPVFLMILGCSNAKYQLKK